MSTENLDDLEALFEAARAEAELAATATADKPADAPTESRATEQKILKCPNAQDGEVCTQCTCGNARQIRDRLGQITRNLEMARMDMLQRGIEAEQVETRLAEIRHDSEENTKRRLKLFFVLGRLAEEQNISVSEAEVNCG